MVVLSVQNLTKMFGAEELFHGVSFTVNENDRIAIIGNNGTGKSTLLKMILGQEEITLTSYSDQKGVVAFSKGVRYGYLSQDVIESLDHTLKEEALLVFKDVIEVEHQLNELMEQYSKEPHNVELESAYSRKLAQFERMGGYDYEYLITMMLSKFGFGEDVINRPIRSFSGGERTKMAFVKLLLIKPDILILDEPTNHLDVSTIDWLEQYLKTYSGAILFVSHDRYFINNVANKIIELENQSISTYVGNFDSYLVQKQERYELAMKEYTIQQKEIEKMKRFIEYFKPKPRFVSRAKDREKKLEHLVLKEKPKKSETSIRFNFEGEVREDKKIIYFDECEIGYDKTLIKSFSFYLFGGDKLAIMGDNGTGKTTLLKCILQQLQPLSGEIHRLHPLNIGYIQQNDFIIDDDISLLNYFLDLFPLMGEKEIRNHLGKFGFTGDDVFKNVSILSGGEKMKLVLARIVLLNYDVLILDEPTNHLDLITREALILAMQQYNACIIFVSHDRYFINCIANKILYISQTVPHYHEGDYDSFKEKESSFTDSVSNDDKHENKTITGKVKTKSSVNPAKLEDEIKKIEKQLQTIKEDEFKEENYLDTKKMEALEIKRKELEKKYEELSDVFLSLDI